MKRIYLDHAATTPLLPEVREAMLPWLGDEYGNPSSLYQEGAKAKAALDTAREAVSSALGCLFGEVLFTGSGSEAANLALVGTALAHKGDRKTVVISASEHHCVTNTRPILERLGYQVVTAPVDRWARVDLEALKEWVDEKTLLVSVMHANNELGTINDVSAVAETCKSYGALFHCDAVQTFPLLNDELWSVEDLGADLVTVSAHKLGGPKGVGALYVRGGTDIEPVIAGGGQERDMRGGTENVAGIVGFGIASKQRVEDKSYMSYRTYARDAFLESLEGDYVCTTEGQECLSGHLHLRFPGVSAESLLIVVDRMGVSASAGAACSSGSVDASHVMLACGYPEDQAREGVRFTFSGSTTVEESKEAAARVSEAVASVLAVRTQS